MARILIRYRTGSKAGTVEVFPVPRYQALYLGRDAGCDVRFHPEEDAMVSRNHAVIEWKGGEDAPLMFRISDLLSSNGTFVNARKIGQAALLRPGDRIGLGSNGPLIDFDFEESAELSSSEPAAVGSTQQMQAIDPGMTRMHRRR